MAHDVFISYAKENKPVADAICAMLEQHNVRCWIAPRDVLPGRQYGEAIVDALDSSKVMVLVFSSYANQSPQVAREVERAVAKRLALVPFRLEDVPLSKHMEYFISAPHWLDAMTPPLHEKVHMLSHAVQALLAQLDGRSPPADARARVPARAARPERNRWAIAAAIGALAIAAIAVVGYGVLQRSREPPTAAVPATEPETTPTATSVPAPWPAEQQAKAPTEPKPRTTPPTETREPTTVAKSSEPTAKPSESVAPPPQQPVASTERRGAERLPSSPAYKQPTRWQDYEGFNDLVGRWRGTDRDGLVIEMDVPATEADEVIATVRIPRMNCSMSVRLARATEQFTTSQFYWKPTTSTPGCPDMESLYTNPVSNLMTWRWTFTSGQQTQVILERRI